MKLGKIFYNRIQKVTKFVDIDKQPNPISSYPRAPFQYALTLFLRARSSIYFMACRAFNS